MRLTQGAIALVSAALRHVRDAEHLADASNPARSLDQAYHLAGYGPECARKATLSIRFLDKAIGHRFGQKVEDVLDFALALDPLAQRYQPMGWAQRYPALRVWREDVRYDRTGTYGPAAVAPLLTQAREAVDSVVLALWADGRLGDGGVPW